MRAKGSRRRCVCTWCFMRIMKVRSQSQRHSRGSGTPVRNRWEPSTNARRGKKLRPSRKKAETIWNITGLLACWQLWFLHVEEIHVRYCTSRPARTQLEPNKMRYGGMVVPPPLLLIREISQVCKSDPQKNDWNAHPDDPTRTHQKPMNNNYQGTPQEFRILYKVYHYIYVLKNMLPTSWVGILQ